MERTAAKAIRKIVKIDETKCDGCGICVTACAEGALKIVNGKARLISDKYCDNLGACLPGCPLGAISIIEREGEAFDEQAVKKHLASQHPPAPDKVRGCPSSTVLQFEKTGSLPCGCPSSAVSQFKETSKTANNPEAGIQVSELAHWPVQMTLVPPGAPFLKGADVLLAADCTAFSCGDFHIQFLKDHALLVACPKLDDYEAHLAKLTSIIRQSDIKSLTVVRMEVPCCSGLTRMAMQAVLSSGKDIPFKEVILGTRGYIKT
jgi:Fe-S-cluster-containing hydrogenase component 2